MPIFPCAHDEFLRAAIYAGCYTEAFDSSAYALSQININHGLALRSICKPMRRWPSGTISVLISATFEFGGKFRNAHKFDDTYLISTAPNSGVSIPVSQFPSVLSNNNYYGGAYPLGPNPAFNAVLAFANANPSEFTTASSQGVDPSNYDLIEKSLRGLCDEHHRFVQQSAYGRRCSL